MSYYDFKFIGYCQRTEMWIVEEQLNTVNRVVVTHKFSTEDAAKDFLKKQEEKFKKEPEILYCVFCPNTYFNTTNCVDEAKNEAMNLKSKYSSSPVYIMKSIEVF